VGGANRKRRMAPGVLGALLAAVVLAAVASAGTGPSALALADGAGTKVLVLTPKELPGWRLGQNQAVVSGDYLALLDPRISAPTRNRTFDGWVARYAQTHTIISSGGFLTSGPAAARAIVKHILAAPAQPRAVPYHRVPIGDGGAASISQGSGALHSTVDLVWSSGRYVIAIGTQTIGPKPQFSQAQVLALARKVQARVSSAG
jgi:hypothetical protein